jgi:hypothetical protein
MEADSCVVADVLYMLIHMGWGLYMKLRPLRIGLSVGLSVENLCVIVAKNDCIIIVD